MRQPADEADGVGHEVPAPVGLEAARRRVERLEQPVLDRHVGAGERVQERRLADVRVAGEGDRRRLGALPLLAPRRALPLDRLQLAAQDGDPVAGQAAVGLELRLARAARPDAAAEALEVLPHAAHARQVVVELGELDLELALGGHRVLREDVEDQLRPVDHARVERVLEEALLRRVELVVDEQALGFELLELLLDLLELALADVGALRGTGAMLNRPTDGDHAGGARELLDLGELLGGIHALGRALQGRTRAPAPGNVESSTVIMPASDPTPTLAETALALVNIPSESRSEEALYGYVAAQVPLGQVFADGETLVYAKRGGKPLVLLAGHLDTVPAQGQPARAGSRTAGSSGSARAT